MLTVGDVLIYVLAGAVFATVMMVTVAVAGLANGLRRKRWLLILRAALVGMLCVGFFATLLVAVPVRFLSADNSPDDALVTSESSDAEYIATRYGLALSAVIGLGVLGIGLMIGAWWGFGWQVSVLYYLIAVPRVSTLIMFFVGIVLVANNQIYDTYTPHEEERDFIQIGVVMLLGGPLLAWVIDVVRNVAKPSGLSALYALLTAAAMGLLFAYFLRYDFTMQGYYESEVTFQDVVLLATLIWYGVALFLMLVSVYVGNLLLAWHNVYPREYNLRPTD